MSLLTWLGVAALGGAGALLRFAVDGAVASRTPGELPFGTLAVNATGALALGAVAGAALQGDARVLAGTAALGSYTTFSTWLFETHRLSEDGRIVAAVVNLVVPFAVGFAAIAAGRALA
ncbi:MAG TPA: fluoride efflux transporter CrcB [Solirubrobacteraceae bacterium]